MSNRYWSKWGDSGHRQTVGFTRGVYYIKEEDSKPTIIFPEELDDLVYKILEVKRKVEGE